MSATWFDSHCHLHICEEDGASADDVITAARAAGVVEMLTVGIDEASCERSVELASNDGVYAAVGLHPNSAGQWSDAFRERLRDWLAHDRVVAVGETGLDFYRDWAAPEAQRDVFAEHIALAKGHRKAMVIHTRDSVEAALDVLESVGAPERTIFHCWSGDAAALRRALDLGCFVSFAGNVSFKSAADLREAAAAAPADRLLVETDSPYLTPVPHRGKPNSPANVVHVGAAVAEARGVPPQEIAEVTTANARRVFGLG